MTSAINKSFVKITITVITMLFCSIILGTKASAETFPAGWEARVANDYYPVYSGPSTEYSVQDYLYPYEGVSVLSASGYTFYIEYSNVPNGVRRGYLINPSFSDNNYGTAVEEVLYTCTVYAGPDTSEFVGIGTVYSGEFVAELACENGWSYIEYNTSNGRKRGYVYTSNLTNIKNVNLMLYNDDYFYSYTYYVNGTFDVYGGPSEGYAVIGSVSYEYVDIYRSFLYGDGTFCYIEYQYGNTSMKKSGYILFE